MTERDFVAEMRAVVDAEIGDGPYVSRVVAEQVVKKLRATDRELLDGWLDQQAETFVWQFINDRDRSIRARAVASSKSRAFAEAVDEHEQGDSTKLAGWLAVPFAVEDGSRKGLRDMLKADLLFAGDAYEARATQNRMKATFLRALAKKVGKRKVSEVFTDEQLTAMWNSLGGDSE